MGRNELGLNWKNSDCSMITNSWNIALNGSSRLSRWRRAASSTRNPPQRASQAIVEPTELAAFGWKRAGRRASETKALAWRRRVINQLGFSWQPLAMKTAMRNFCLAVFKLDPLRRHCEPLEWSLKRTSFWLLGPIKGPTGENSARAYSLRNKK